MFGFICIIAIIGVAFLINHAIGGMGEGIVKLFQKIGFGKTASYVFGGCLFLVVLAILKHLLASSGMFV